MPTSRERPGFTPVVIATTNAFGDVLKAGFGAVRIRFHLSI
jgi:hypothetical protein